MSENIQNIDVDSDEFLDAPKALRDHVKKLQSRLGDLTSELSEVRSQATATALGDVLSAYKNPERVKKDLLSDKVNPLDNEAVAKWLEANGDDYAKGSTDAGSSSTDTVSAEERAAAAAISSASEFTQPADMSKLQAAQAEMTSETTGQDFIELARKHGL